MLVRLRRGSARLILDRKPYEISTGELFFTPTGAHEIWHWDPSLPTVHDFIHWTGDVADSALPRRCAAPVGSLLHTLVSHVTELDFIRTPDGCREQKLALSLLLSVYAHGTAETATSHSHDGFRRIVAALRTQWRGQNFRPPTIAELCVIACLSKPQLIRVCKAACGETPARFCERLRLHQGANRLVSSSESVEQVADRLGYASQFHFSRNIKRYYGLAPLPFRRRYHNQPEAISGHLPAELLRAYRQVLR